MIVYSFIYDFSKAGVIEEEFKEYYYIDVVGISTKYCLDKVKVYNADIQEVQTLNKYVTKLAIGAKDGKGFEITVTSKNSGFEKSFIAMQSILREKKK